MLRITIEIVPYGQEEHKRTLSQFEIVNTGLISGNRDTYIVRKSRDEPTEVARFQHIREHGHLVCLEQALAKLQGRGLTNL